MPETQITPDRALEADDIVRALDLVPHPEGGHYRETFRDRSHGGRAASTAIYYLLRQGEWSRWHRIDAAEVWHWYAGATLELCVMEKKGELLRHRLGSHLLQGERPQVVVPRGCWQSARSLGAWTLVGCTVAPGFEFAGFELAPDDFTP